MPSGLLGSSRDSSKSVGQQLPFAGEGVDAQDSPREQTGRTRSASTSNTYFGHGSPRPIFPPSQPTSSAILSSSFTSRTPTRSFFHHASQRLSADAPQYSSHGVRDRTQELAAYALDDDSFHDLRRPSRTQSDNQSIPLRREQLYEGDQSEGRYSLDTASEVIEEESEPDSPEAIRPEFYQTNQAPLIPSLRDENDVRSSSADRQRKGYGTLPQVRVQDTEAYGNTEVSPLIPKPRLTRGVSERSYGKQIIPQEPRKSSLRTHIGETLYAGQERVANIWRSTTDPKNYTKEAAIQHAKDSAQMVSAVFLGLLLNVLDALSYGYILFPLGNPIFSHTGPDGISIFFVSCIVSQLCFSLGLSMFRGGVGSEMIEVVPFFHKMTYSIIARMQGASNEAIIATVIVAYCLSSIVTGLIFLGLGVFKLGNLVSFFPRNILIGCIGGVGFFLFVTGIEVSARLEGNLNYDLDTLHKLFAHDTVMLWLTPLLLAILILFLRRMFKNPFILPGFFIGVFAIFYLVVKAILKSDLEDVRNAGWIFEQPEAGVPFYRFYTYFDFKLVDWGALASTIPAMLALSFFGIIHVPINVPALGVAVKEDDMNVNRELIAHGVSNTLSGLVGSIQNYLVYANSILFIQNGGDSRAAGLLLAAATFGVLIAGPAMIGFIPVCIVGALIFMLGIELLQEAVWDTYGKLNRLEYLTIIAIVLIMGIYDFVVGIFVGIVLACLNYVVQSSRTPAIRASYTGDVAESTVRRPRADRRYLDHVRGQIRVMKLSGHLFFGTIVAVEDEMRNLIHEHNFKQQPISFIIVDFSHVTDIDFSGSEGFQRINRILTRRNVKMLLSGVSFSNSVGQGLRNVGLLDEEKGDDDCPPPQVFENLNAALEACENELLESFYMHRSVVKKGPTPPISISPPSSSSPNSSNASFGSPSLHAASLAPEFQSPRRGAQYLAAARTLKEQGGETVSENKTVIPAKWRHFNQPVKIMLQTFEDVSDQNEDFWHRAAKYFQRREYPAGTVLYSRGDEPDGFYILEQGRFRADYELEQGGFSEVICPGTTCGELPFFSESERTGTVAAEKDSVAWLLTREKYKEMEGKSPDVAGEFLKIGLRLTKERMDAVTSYVLVTAT